jgi:hypothetical protein
MSEFPDKIEISSNVYLFGGKLGHGKEGRTARYVTSDGLREVVLKISHCGDLERIVTAETELRLAAAFSQHGNGLRAAVRSWRAPDSLGGSAVCLYSAFPYYRVSLDGWLRENPRRSPRQILMLTHSILRLFLRLRSSNLLYTDIKGDNLLVVDSDPKSLGVVVGDLGGLTLRRGMTHTEATITPELIPSYLKESLTADKLDIVEALLLGELLLKLVAREPTSLDRDHPFDSLLRCVAPPPSERTSQSLMESCFRHHIFAAVGSFVCEHISLRDPEILTVLTIASLLVGAHMPPPLTLPELVEQPAVAAFMERGF